MLRDKQGEVFCEFLEVVRGVVRKGVEEERGCAGEAADDGTVAKVSENRGGRIGTHRVR